nr:4Fe-4S ferredoxin, iron-sulfur binding domain protein [Mycolicibacterium gilvum PYR-GCK]
MQSRRDQTRDFRPLTTTAARPTVDGMTYVIGSACVDIVDKSCVQECPADCIYEGDRAMYINPNECVDCGACRIACRVDAIYYETDLPDEELAFLDDNAAFFTTTLSGRDEPLGDPGGAAKLGRVGADTPLVAALPASTTPHP